MERLVCVCMVVIPAKCLRAKGSLNPGNAEHVNVSKQVPEAQTTLVISRGFLPYLSITALRGGW